MFPKDTKELENASEIILSEKNYDIDCMVYTIWYQFCFLFFKYLKHLCMYIKKFFKKTPEHRNINVTYS